MKRTIVTAACIATLSSTTWAAEWEIPRSMAGDKGRYYLVEAVKKGNVVSSLHKRIGPNETGYSLVETDCGTLRYRDIGYSETGPHKIKPNPGQWTDIQSGSSKSDLVHYVCKNVK